MFKTLSILICHSVVTKGGQVKKTGKGHCHGLFSQWKIIFKDNGKLYFCPTRNEVLMEKKQTDCIVSLEEFKVLICLLNPLTLHYSRMSQGERNKSSKT